MKYMTICSRILFAVVILFGCSKQPSDNLSAKEKEFAKKVPTTSMNESLSIVVESKKQYFSSGSEIQLLIVNKSSLFISLDLNNQMKLLMYTGDQWVDVQNVLTYPSENPQLAPAGSFPSDELHIFVKPVLGEDWFTDENATLLLRIVVLGETMTGGTPTGEIVGAYTEVSSKESVSNTTTVIIQSTAESITFDGGSISGTITSADNVGEPLPNVIVQLETHPFFNTNNEIEVIATTTSDLEGKFHFDQVEPGIYALHTRISLTQGGACETTDWSKSINIEVGSVVTANLSLACSYQ